MISFNTQDHTGKDKDIHCPSTGEETDSLRVPATENVAWLLQQTHILDRHACADVSPGKLSGREAFQVIQRGGFQFYLLPALSFSNL